nr:ATP-binding protein [Granulicella arctica]
MIALALPPIAIVIVLVFEHTDSAWVTIIAGIAASAVCAVMLSVFFEQITRPLQTLSNVVAALREDDFTFRARGARRGDSLGDLALEINALASTLQHQRSTAVDALTLVELVMTSMQSPVLAFDAASVLLLLNPAAERAFSLQRVRAIGCTADELGLSSLVRISDQQLYGGDSGRDTMNSAESPDSGRWSVYRTSFRLHGVPHTLFVLADVGAALREEERLAWQRLIRVLSHEINNSLTPIKSIAGSLRSRMPSTDLEEGSRYAEHASRQREFERGLAVIEDRADSLNRFLQAYQKLSRLPAPNLQPTELMPLISRVIQLETRLPVQLEGGPDVLVQADPDQLQQLLINLIRNAADAALAPEAEGTDRTPWVAIKWTIAATQAVLRIDDNGPGLLNTANLFVPFYTTKPGGTGVGLVLAQQIATAHRGSITLRNRESLTGCSAEIRLPVSDR